MSSLRVVALLLLACAVTPYAAAAPLDEPAVSRSPTVRAEIRRAHIAATACISLPNRHLPGTQEATRDIIEYYECMEKIVSDAARNGAYSEAFELGICFQELIDLSIQIQAAYSSAPYNKSPTAKTIGDTGRSILAKFRKMAQALNLSPEQVCAAAGWEDCDSAVMPSFREWK